MRSFGRLFTRIFLVFTVLLLLSAFITPAFAQSVKVSPGVLLITQAVPPAQTAPPISNMDIRAFLQWLIGGGGSILAVSWILERLKWFQKLTPDGRDYTIFGAAVIVGCGALAIVMYVPPPILDAVAPFFLIVASTFVTVFIAKLFHSTDKVGG
jgi:hypothetical protein